MAKKIRPENDIERLTNQQMVLLTFLIAIISAIASAIAVIRFYERNPQIVTKIINKKEIVQQTIEKTPEVKVNRTVVIRESDLVSKAIEKNSQYLLDIILKNEDSDMKVASAVKFDNKIFTSPFDFAPEDKIFINNIEIKKIGEKNGIFIFQEVEGSLIKDMKAITALPKLGSTTINLFSKTHVEKSSVIHKINDQVFSQSLKRDNISLVINLSGKVIGLGINGKIYSLTYFKN